jgi:hypothetical protein
LDARFWKCGVEWDVGGVNLQHRQQGNIRFDGFVEQKADAIAGPDALVNKVSRYLIGPTIKLLIRQLTVFGDDREQGPETVAALLEQMVEPFATAPANCSVGARQDGPFKRMPLFETFKLAHCSITAQRPELLGAAERRSGLQDLIVKIDLETVLPGD